jgi:multicomponent Na+:H+ antiporter subunit D
VEANMRGILVVLAVSTILNASYFLPVVYRAFFRKPEGEFTGIKEAPAVMVVSLVITALGAVSLFFRPGVFLELARITVAGVTGGVQ